jgi:hypothetical protein
MEPPCPPSPPLGPPRGTQLAPEREAPASAGTGRYVNIDFVNEHGS